MECPRCKKNIDLRKINPEWEWHCTHCNLPFGFRALAKYASLEDRLSICQCKEYLEDEKSLDYLEETCQECRCYNCLFNINNEHADMLADMGFDNDEELREWEEGYAPDND